MKMIVVFALTLVFAASSFGQGPRHGADGGARRLEFLAGSLELSDAQKQQADAIFSAAEEGRRNTFSQMAAAHEALEAAVKANASDAELERLAASLGNVHAQAAAIQAKSSAKFYALLTPEQKQKYDELGQRRRREARH